MTTAENKTWDVGPMTPELRDILKYEVATFCEMCIHEPSDWYAHVELDRKGRAFIRMRIHGYEGHMRTSRYFGKSENATWEDGMDAICEAIQAFKQWMQSDEFFEDSKIMGWTQSVFMQALWEDYPELGSPPEEDFNGIKLRKPIYEVMADIIAREAEVQS